METLYTFDSVSKLVDDLTENSGYTKEPLSLAKIRLGSFVLVAPDELHYSFCVDEVETSYNSCAYSVRKIRKISKNLKKRIELVRYGGNSTWAL